MTATARPSPSLPLTLPGRKTASGGLATVPRLRAGRWRPQPTDAPGKMHPGYDRARRCSHLPQSGNGCKAPPISAAERAAAQRGDRSAFWNSRLAAGDPLAGTALGIVNNNTFSGQIANQILQSAVVAHSPTMHWQGVANEMQSIGVDIMRAHVGAIDRFGSPNTSQITDYHRDVFNAHGFPGSTFGGTAIFGSASLTNAITGWAGCRF